MRTTAFAILLVFFVSAAQAKIYRWVDKNGSVHFSDKPSSDEAEEIIIVETGIDLVEASDAEGVEQPAPTEPPTEKSQANGKQPSADRAGRATQAAAKKKVVEDQAITEADYKITTTIGKLGADLISISGRIGSGPKCYDLTIIATATNENGLTATIKDQVRKSSSFGSVTYKGTAKAVGSGEDRGFWKVDSVSVRCNDVEE
ncbi:MAG: DUF4124 domain-containing protein [Desulfuromonadales bacterium]